MPFVEGVAAALRAQGIRVEVDAGDDRMQKKIRTHTLQKVPFLLLAGARDAEAGAVSFRFRDGTAAQRGAGGRGGRRAGRLGAPAGEHLADAETFPAPVASAAAVLGSGA